MDVGALFSGVIKYVQRLQVDPRYRAKIQVLPYDRASVAAAKAMSHAYQPRRENFLPVFADGSALTRGSERDYIPSPVRGGYSVYIAHPFREHEWVGVACAVPFIYDCTNSELLGLAEAVNLVAWVRRCGFRMGSCTRWGINPVGQAAGPELTVHLFSDSQNALNLISKGQELRYGIVRIALYQPIVADIVQRLHWLACNGVTVVFHWLPGHGHSVYPHQMADQSARDFAYSGGVSIPEELTFLGQRYQPVGQNLQNMVLELGRRHPNLDEGGRGHIYAGHIQ